MESGQGQDLKGRDWETAFICANIRLAGGETYPAADRAASVALGFLTFGGWLTGLFELILYTGAGGRGTSFIVCGAGD